MEAFPQSIAAALLGGIGLEPIHRSTMSLLYSDICGFTKLSSSMDPGQVSRMLNRLFAKFDRLAHLHGVQKVDIIGDAYVAATNLLVDQPDDHAQRLARFAADMLEAARATRVDPDDGGGEEGGGPPPPPAGGGIPLRVGLHCGPVTGSVVSPGSARYTLIGETVNVAMAMESSGAPGRIQCSAAFARLAAAQAHGLVLRPR